MREGHVQKAIDDQIASRMKELCGQLKPNKQLLFGRPAEPRRERELAAEAWPYSARKMLAFNMSVGVPTVKTKRGAR